MLDENKAPALPDWAGNFMVAEGAYSDLAKAVIISKTMSLICIGIRIILSAVYRQNKNHFVRNSRH